MTFEYSYNNIRIIRIRTRTRTRTHTHALIDASSADIGRHNINRVRSNNNVFCLHLEDFCDGTGVLILTLDKEFLVIGTNTNQACLIQGTHPVV